eukprot:1710534-Rhodomonas_salina.2
MDVGRYYNNRLLPENGEARLRSVPHVSVDHARTGPYRLDAPVVVVRNGHAQAHRQRVTRMVREPRRPLYEAFAELARPVFELSPDSSHIKNTSARAVERSGHSGWGRADRNPTGRRDAGLEPETGCHWQMYCWHQCMDYTPDANPTTCEEQGLKLQCMNQRDQVVDTGLHGDHNPTCSNSDTTESPPDPLLARFSRFLDGCKSAVQIPQPSEALSCGWNEYLNLNAYENSLEIHPGKTYLMWNVEGGNTVKMRMAYNGYLG